MTGKSKKMRGTTTGELEFHIKGTRKKKQPDEGKRYIKDRRKKRNQRAG